MEDFNANVGYNNTRYEQIMGRHGIGQMNENGERFAELCVNNKYVTEGRIFAPKRIYKATWVSPDHITENQIDHIFLFECNSYSTLRDDFTNSISSIVPNY